MAASDSLHFQNLPVTDTVLSIPFSAPPLIASPTYRLIPLAKLNVVFLWSTPRTYYRREWVKVRESVRAAIEEAVLQIWQEWI